MPFVNLALAFASFPSIFARISMFEHFRGDWAYAEPIFFWAISNKFFFFKIFTLILLDRFLDGFWKFWFFIGEIWILIRDFWVIFENYSMRMLSIRGNDFNACWAYAEPISSHVEHTRNEFQPAVKCEHFYMYNPYAERILSHAEHTGNRFHRMLSMRGNV